MTTRDEVLAVTRELLSKEAAKASLLKRVGKSVKRKALIGGAGLAAVAAGVGAVSAVKEDNAKRSYAPPAALPPGY
jgi:hypothetical protein